MSFYVEYDVAERKYSFGQKTVRQTKHFLNCKKNHVLSSAPGELVALMRPESLKERTNNLETN